MYKRYDMALSCLLVESIVSSTYHETIRTRLSHCANFDDLPGSVYYMMVLEACNMSAAIDVKTAKTKFDELALSNFPGENVSELAVMALKYIKVMKGGFSLPTDLASTLLMKVCNTGIEIFN